jgi:hypothetical protein
VKCETNPFGMEMAGEFGGADEARADQFEGNHKAVPTIASGNWELDVWLG